jgi:hypothetical protein
VCTLTDNFLSKILVVAFLSLISSNIASLMFQGEPTDFGGLLKLSTIQDRTQNQILPYSKPDFFVDLPHSTMRKKVDWTLHTL